MKTRAPSQARSLFWERTAWTGSATATFSKRFGFIELGVVPAMRPGLHSKMNFIFFSSSSFTRRPDTHREKEKLSPLMYTFEEKTFFVEGKVLTFLFCFVFRFVVKHSHVKFVLTTQKTCM